MIFHNYDSRECPGILVSSTASNDPDHPLSIMEVKCAECGDVVGTIERGALDQLIELAEKGGAKKAADQENGSERCEDCEKAKQLAWSDATTPGFFRPYCQRHAPKEQP